MNFIRQEAGNILIFLLLGAVNLFLWAAYDLPGEPVLYSLAADILFLVLFELFRAVGYCQGKRALEKALEADGLDISSLPGKEVALGEEYRRLVAKREEKLQGQLEKKEVQADGLKKYYGMWSHQIKTPIAGIRLLLSEEPVDVRAVKRELYRIEQYVESTLWFQRIQEGNNDLLLRTYSTEDILKQVIKRNSPLLLRSDLKLELKPYDYPILTDRKWMEFILEQLLSNAAKYTKAGTVRIRVKDIEEAVDILIEDTGIGIRQEDLPRIFEWGYTGWNGHENKKSTGIGLALCRQAAELLGHELVIDSELGKGTRATVRIYRPRVNLKE
ncbi:MAG: sensor histidine kinase [Acetivibrio ethanolgignens]